MQNMESNLTEFVTRLERDLPEFVSDRDLLTLGIVRTPAHLSLLRSKGQTPPFFKIGASIRYLKGDVISWFKGQCHYPEMGVTIQAAEEVVCG